ncbi:hypothetical protein K1719_037755 [Acacia pycnantha]|nr:hypothetical protein K1719_037755 [Acacia pycnantha]
MAIVSRVDRCVNGMDLHRTFLSPPMDCAPASASNHVSLAAPFALKLRFRSVCNSWRISIPPSLPNSPSSFPLQIPHPISPSMFVFLTHSSVYRIEPPHHVGESLTLSDSFSDGLALNRVFQEAKGKKKE